MCAQRARALSSSADNRDNNKIQKFFVLHSWPQRAPIQNMLSADDDNQLNRNVQFSSYCIAVERVK